MKVEELQRKVRGGVRTKRILNWNNPRDRALMEESAFVAAIRNDPKRRIKSRLSVNW